MKNVVRKTWQEQFAEQIENVNKIAEAANLHWVLLGHEDPITGGWDFRKVFSDTYYEVRKIADDWKKFYRNVNIEYLLYIDNCMDN